MGAAHVDAKLERDTVAMVLALGAEDIFWKAISGGEHCNDQSRDEAGGPVRSEIKAIRRRQMLDTAFGRASRHDEPLESTAHPEDSPCPSPRTSFGNPQ